MSKANTHQVAKKRRQNLLISVDGHNHRIKEQKRLIKDAKRVIKMHKLLIKQSKVTAKLEELNDK